MCSSIAQRILKHPSFAPVRVVVGTHRDKSDQRQVSYAEAIDLKRDHGVLWFEVSPDQNVPMMQKQFFIRATFAVKQAVEAEQLPLVPRSALFDHQSALAL